MRNDIPAKPNHAVAGLLMSAEMRALMFEKGEEAQALYREVVAKRTGQLARSARVETFIGGEASDRWCARLIVGGSVAPHGVPHQWGFDGGDDNVQAGFFELNEVLNMLAGQ